MRSSRSFGWFGRAMLGVLVLWSASVIADDRYAEARRKMIEAIESTHRDVSLSADHGRFDAATLTALGTVPRHEFVRESDLGRAYDNRPLPIGHGQTISQPYIVALMTDLLHVKAGDRVLEIGTGSGYQSAVLATLGASVWSIEIVPPLGERAAKTLAHLGYAKVTTKIADGYYGWPDNAPFDAIIVTAAVSHVPPPLVQQLKPGGRLVIPVGSAFMTQELVLVEKDAQGAITNRQILPVQFVPLTGGH